ncbi:MAG: AI-2E family transporter [Dehalococcoidales bacterium]|nr:AI-2E family transporter [Dehalococcoidales bacterium]
MNSFNSLFRKHWQLITFIISLLLLVWLIWKFIIIVAPFLIGLIIAYLLLPIVRWLEKHLPGGKKHPGLKRISIIIGVYFIGLIIIAASAFYMFTVVSSSASLLWQNVPQMISNIIAWIQKLMATVRLEVPASMLQQYDQSITNGGVTVVEALRNGLGRGFSIIATGAGLVLGFLSLPLIVFFILKDWDSLRDGFFDVLPSWMSVHAKNVAGILEKVLGRYIRGQLILSVFVGILVFILLSVLRVEFAPALAVWAALMENIPTLGFWLSIAASVAIALATSPEKAIWIILGLAVVQLIENNLLAPRVQGSVWKMNPVFILLISLMGAYVFGMIGFIVAAPLVATVIELLKYFRRVYHSTTVTTDNGKALP